MFARRCRVLDVLLHLPRMQMATKDEAIQELMRETTDRLEPTIERLQREKMAAEQEKAVLEERLGMRR